MNVLIALTQSYGDLVLRGFGVDRSQWKIIGYGGPLLANKADTLIIINPTLMMWQSETEKETVFQWFRECVPLMKVRSSKVIEIGDWTA